MKPLSVEKNLGKLLLGAFAFFMVGGFLTVCRVLVRNERVASSASSGSIEPAPNDGRLARRLARVGRIL